MPLPSRRVLLRVLGGREVVDEVVGVLVGHAVAGGPLAPAAVNLVHAAAGRLGDVVQLVERVLVAVCEDAVDALVPLRRRVGDGRLVGVDVVVLDAEGVAGRDGRWIRRRRRRR